MFNYIVFLIAFIRGRKSSEVYFLLVFIFAASLGDSDLNVTMNLVFN